MIYIKKKRKKKRGIRRRKHDFFNFVHSSSPTAGRPLRTHSTHHRTLRRAEAHSLYIYIYIGRRTDDDSPPVTSSHVFRVDPRDRRVQFETRFPYHFFPRFFRRFTRSENDIYTSEKGLFDCRLLCVKKNKTTLR